MSAGLKSILVHGFDTAEHLSLVLVAPLKDEESGSDSDSDDDYDPMA